MTTTDGDDSHGTCGDDTDGDDDDDMTMNDDEMGDGLKNKNRIIKTTFAERILYYYGYIFYESMVNAMFCMIGCRRIESLCRR